MGMKQSPAQPVISGISQLHQHGCHVQPCVHSLQAETRGSAHCHAETGAPAVLAREAACSAIAEVSLEVIPSCLAAVLYRQLGCFGNLFRCFLTDTI